MRMIRTAVFWLHLAIGCAVGLVILVMSVTGVLLAFERQINAWADAPAVLQTQSQSATESPLDTILANLKNGGQGVPSELILHRSPKAPMEARFGRERTLYLNPWSGEIVGEPAKGSRAFFNFAERVHRSLGMGMQSALGRGVTGAANLAFLFMLLSGLYLWLPRAFNSAGLRSRILVRRGLVGRTREWNWHHVAGIWAVLPLLFIVVTGVIMSYPWASNLLFTMTGSQPPSGSWGGERPAGQSGGNGVDHPAAGNDASASQFIPLAGLAQIAKQQEPQWKSITIQVPLPESDMLAVSVDRSIGGQPEKTSQLILNRQTGRVQSVKRFSDNSIGRKLRAWARFTHTGEEFGVLGEMIAAIASIGSIVLVWTGISMAIRRAVGAQTIKSVLIGGIQTDPSASGSLDEEAIRL